MKKVISVLLAVFYDGAPRNSAVCGVFVFTKGDAGKRRRDVLQNLIANHALDVLRRYLTGLPVS